MKWFQINFTDNTEPFYTRRMLLNNDNFDNFSRVGYNKNVEIEGLDRFTKNLEKHFFSQVTIRNCSSTTNSVNLVVELDSNFELLETLHYFTKETWGNFNCPENSFAGALTQLRVCNELAIEVEELSLFFKDTSIIVNRIYDQSIAEQFENILISLNEHFEFFTKGVTELPYEIYIPVFEDDLMENEHTLLMNIQSGNNSAQDYFSFWGLYYYSEDDASVYDLKNRSIINGNLQMLNR